MSSVSTTIVRESINNDYEWIQYNNDLRIIRSKKDDMFQAQSILNALGSKKKVFHWLENTQTKELLKGFEEEFSSIGFPRDAKIKENRPNLPIHLRGLYVHRLLVNSVASWASPKYAIKIYRLLDSLFETERNELEAQIVEKDAKIEQQQKQLEIKDNKIKNLKSRAVPEGREHKYVYCVYMDEGNDWNTVRIHFVRCDKRRISRALKGVEHDQILFYKECLPCSMSVNDDVKEIIAEIVPDEELKFERCSGAAIINYDYLDDVVESIQEYLDAF